jgi:hypothetical protein
VAGGSLLDHATELVDLLEVPYVQLRDEVAAAGQVGDLALVLEDAQCLADRRDADADPLGDVFLVDAVARTELTSDECASQPLDGVLLRGPERAQRNA